MSSGCTVLPLGSAALCSRQQGNFLRRSRQPFLWTQIQPVQGGTRPSPFTQQAHDPPQVSVSLHRAPTQIKAIYFDLSLLFLLMLLIISVKLHSKRLKCWTHLILHFPEETHVTSNVRECGSSLECWLAVTTHCLPVCFFLSLTPPASFFFLFFFALQFTPKTICGWG